MSRNEQFFTRMRERFQLAESSLAEIHREAILDFKFRLGGDDQWDPTMLSRRRADGRPCYSVNRIPTFLRQVMGEQKKSRPAIQVSPIGDGADVETAEIVQGLVRHIERTSNAEDAYDTAFDHMATCGFGFIRLLTEYVDDDSNDQEIKYQRELNPFAHYPDPRCKEADYSDAKFWFVVDEMLADDYDELYPGSSISGIRDFEGGAIGGATGWIGKATRRVAEYFWVEEKLKTVGKGKNQREKPVREVHWIKTNGIEELEAERILPGEYIPIVPVLGEDIRIENKRHLIGLVRYQRTPQALYNLWTSAMAEAIATHNKVPYLTTPKQTQGFEDIWDDAHNGNYSRLPYNPDPNAPPPSRQSVEPAIQAITEALAHADNDLKSTVGIYDASLGAPGPEQSGKAILLRQKQGDDTNFGFVDSMAKTIKHLGRIITGWIPAYYDSARIIRIVNPDGSSKTIPINQEHTSDEGLRKVFDLTVGRYDVAISQGPSYDAAREEAAQSILQLVQAQPALMQVVGDLLVSCFDWPMAKEISERLKKMLPPQLQDQAANALPQAQAQLQQAHQMISQLTSALNKQTEKLMAKLPELASRERIALLQAKAGIIEAALKAKSQEAIVAFQADLEQIDRQLALMPDPGMETANNGQNPPATANNGQPPQPLQQQPLAA